ncbi:DNA-3-methyladenine glycosylase 2 family protein [Alicyclobacillus cycloheptanicus]|uniref:DNA-3-methyladenine glycosylase II n=1 Tax=Alicyclobacillus cycloheptanicus TaxID=1457 RepID=A0ABT9XLJ0_9BACL|nr:DNA-3-methyladenine glycosylase 2 family protein [Alicyclobacillus cycloheptanicus]MDQ0190623.1 DNA-3-methyladenine glycosylase II [Alicyclobacillus cycloheptanicus]WDM01824.1 DNA-3-methyladenine glycosylase 2 family protein [Alicyclobacillus cycloheptanicus]
MFHFTIYDDEIKYLVSADNRLGALIQRIGDITVPTSENYFESLAKSIIGQQLSNKAANIITSNVLNHCGELSPKTILTVTQDVLRNCGLSKPKVTYLKDLSFRVVQGDIVFNELGGMTDTEVIQYLTQVKGIGQWTAEMFLIFSLGRINVFSFGDAGLRRAIRWLYQFDDTMSEGDVTCLTEKWNPYKTVASLYLWESINSGLVQPSKPFDI